MKFQYLAVSFLLVSFLCASAIAQDDFQTWLTYNNQTRLSKKWGYTFDLNYRTRGFFPFQSNLAAVRFGGIYFLNEQWRLSGGYAWFGTIVTKNDVKLLNENRLWQQIIWVKRNSKFVFSNRVRIEQRFRKFDDFAWSGKAGSAFTMRYRYMFQAQGIIFPAVRENGFQLGWQAADEIMFQSGDLIGKRAFNQNRIIGGLILSPNRKLDLAVLYQYIIQFQPALSETEEIHSIRLTLLHQLDYR